MNESWKGYFPFADMRPQQEEILNFIIDSLPNHKYIIIQAPTGVGKSAIAITITNLIKDLNKNNPTSYIITTQKILQEQYIKDFPNLANISARSNYECDKRPYINCELAKSVEKVLEKRGAKVLCGHECKYDFAKTNFKNSDVSLTNVAYFLNYKAYAPSMQKRYLLIIDEAHNLENEIVNFVSLSFSKKFTENTLKGKWPDVKNMDIAEFVKWINSYYLPLLNDTTTNLKTKINYLTSKNVNDDASIQLLKKHGSIERIYTNIQNKLNSYDEKTWVLSIASTEDYVELKPLYASNFSESTVFSAADKIILMSGTILDKKTYCKNLGLDEKQTAFISTDSPFPVKNRPIYITNIGSMSKKSYNNTLPTMIDVISEILKHHKDEKGIIHTHTYFTAQAIIKKIKSNRLLIHDSTDRMDVLNFHLNSTEPTVLISPSFTEGIDLCGELSRFQIICKIPFPYMGDVYVQKKMKNCYRWYEWQTAKSIIQALGRSIRSEDDYAYSYILDSDWNFFYAKNKDLFPKWFKDSIVRL